MCSQLRRDDLTVFEELCTRERCPFAVIGYGTEEKRLVLESGPEDRDKPIDLPMNVLFGKPPKTERRFEHVALPTRRVDLSGVTIADAVERLLRLPDDCFEELSHHHW